MALSKLLATDIHLASLEGSVTPHATHQVIRTASNPDYYFGNMFVLNKRPDDLAAWLAAFEREFGPETKHRCLEWSGKELGPKGREQAKDLKLDINATLEMCLSSLPPARSDWEVRPLSLESDREASVKLNLASDMAEQAGDQGYRQFKDRLRATQRRWIESGAATWWGVFDGERLIGQCGFVACGKLGRFQVVETHPNFRRRGVCSNLMSAVARDAIQRLELSDLILAAEVDGPALSLYRSLGFKDGVVSHSLLHSILKLRVRDETKGDHAGVSSLVTAAFKQPGEARLIESLRDSPDAISLVAEQSGGLVGHILFTRIHINGPGSGLAAIALAPMAVRPLAQGKGAGTTLIEEGLKRCRAAGFEICVLIGHADYYPKFGFVPATPLGLNNAYGVTDEHFMVCELRPGALQACAGEVVYADAFNEL